MRVPLHTVVALFLLSSPAVAAEVLLVDSSGGGDFTDLQAAVDAASEGDTIVVRRPPEPPGDPRYGPLVIDGKSLAVVNVRRGDLRVGAIAVRGLGPGQSVVLSGLSVRPGAPSVDAPGLLIQGCAGAVRVQDCVVDGGQASAGRPAVAVRDSADVVLSRSTIRGGAGAGRLDPGGPAIVAASSRVVIQNSEVGGGAGGSEMAFFRDAYGGPGGTGIVVHDSFVHVSGGAVTGGLGGYALYGDPSEGGDGGIGIDASTDSTVYVLGGEVSGGEGGLGDTLVGDPGPDVVGAVTLLAATDRGLSVPDRVEEGGSIPLVFQGEPGETVVLLRSGASRSRLVDPSVGVLHIAPPFERLVLGTLPASGELEVPLAAPDAPAGGAVELVLQGAFVDPSGATRLGPAGHVFVLDGAAPPVCGRRFFVDTDALPGGDGSSWANALQDPNDALVHSADCPEHPTEVWIAEGTYRPEPPGGDRARSFRVWSSTRVHGGFVGTETTLDERDIAAHPTVLDGDLNGDDGPVFSNRSDNAYHVVRSGSSQLPEQDVFLDGLVLRGGSAIGDEDEGGGLLAYGSAGVARCTFTDNQAVWGGAIRFHGLPSHGDRLDVASCRLLRNYAAHSGGAIAGTSRTFGQVRVTGSVLAANHVQFLGFGGGIRIWFECELELTNSVVTANAAPLSTAGVHASPEADATIANCILWANRSHSGVAPQEEQLLVPRGSVDYCCIESLDGSLGGVGNHRFDPRFVDPAGADGIVGTDDDNLRLAAGSPCIDAGANSAVPPDRLDLDGDGDTTEPLPVDLDGAPRFQDDPNAPDVGAGTPPLVDMGAFEHAP